MAQATRPLQIRLATLDDVTEIAAILRDAFVEFQALYTAGGFAATTPDAQTLSARFHEGPVWVALLDGAMVGTVAAIARPDEIYIRSMGVRPQARGHAIGEKLLTEAIAFGASRGYSRFRLSTTPFLGRAIHLYERFQFVRTDDGPHELFGTPLLTMIKTSDISLQS